jgi:hypothetical protein
LQSQTDNEVRTRAADPERTPQGGIELKFEHSGGVKAMTDEQLALDRAD